MVTKYHILQDSRKRKLPCFGSLRHFNWSVRRRTEWWMTLELNAVQSAFSCTFKNAFCPVRNKMLNFQSRLIFCLFSFLESRREYVMTIFKPFYARVPLIYLNTGWLVTVLRFIREREFFRQLNRSEFEKHASSNTKRVPFENKIYVNRNSIQRSSPIRFYRVETRY